jgi:hypothetical protein
MFSILRVGKDAELSDPGEEANEVAIRFYDVALPALCDPNGVQCAAHYFLNSHGREE